MDSLPVEAPPAPVPAPGPPPRSKRPLALLAAALAVAAVVLLAAVLLVRVEGSVWAVEMLEGDELHARGQDGSGVRVCVVDSGVDPAHPALKGITLLAWRDFVAGAAAAYDDNGHGTGMASLIVGRDPIPGTARGASLLVAKAIDGDGDGSDGAVAQAILFCVDPDGDGSRDDAAHIVSLSLGNARRRLFGSAVTNAVDVAVSAGAYVVASAGNDGEDDNGDVDSPASEASVIAVGAVDRSGRIAPFSSVGRLDGPLPGDLDLRTDPDKKPEVVAPGVDLVVAWRGGGYAQVSGTSPATALVSGALALVLQEHPELRGAANLRLDDVKRAIMETAAPQSGQSTPHDPYYGYGLLQARAASDRL